MRGYLIARWELVGLVGLAGFLNLWNLTVNGWANTYYSAAVRSMSLSWHNFLFVSLDRSGLMTVDKPPLSLWVQALSARVFGFHPLSLLVPEALMGMAAVALLYDLVRRHFGRAAGAVAGLALVTTPVIVAVSRHNNPDELLVLCSVAALWCAARALASGRTRWLVASGVCVGLGFETKMGVALLVVPGIAAAWMWVAPRGRLRALRGLLGAGAATVLVGGAWPLLVMLTSAADRPWISGTSDNSILSLIFGYNGLGRVAGQAGGPQAFGNGPGGAPFGGGPGGSVFGGPTGVFRLLQSGLGDQAGWLIGLALVAGVGVAAASRLRRGDPRTGWLIAVGGAFATTAVVFSFAQGIFHPYYVSLLAPFGAALAGAGVGQMLAGGRGARWLAALGLLAGLACELVVLGELDGRLAWARPVIIAASVVAVVGLAVGRSRKLRSSLLAVGLAGLLIAPATWAAETLGHPLNATFPAGGPATTSFPGPGRFAGAGGGPPGLLGAGGAPPGRFGGVGGGSPLPGLFAPGGLGSGGVAPGQAGAPGLPGGFGGGFGGGPRGFGPGGQNLTAVFRYVQSHGGGTIGVESQSTAASAILSTDANVAGLGGFSGRESSVSVRWLADEVRAGRLRWIVAGEDGGGPGDTRTGSQKAFAAVASVCRSVSPTGGAGSETIYDCAGQAGALASLAGG